MAASCPPRWSAWLLGRTPKLRLRTGMAALATAMMLCCTLVMQVLAEDSGIDLRLVHWWGGFAVGGLLAATLAVRSGLSERWSDPSLTFFQILWALTCNAAAYILAGPARPLVLPVLVIILMFGIFGRDRRQTIFLMVYAMALYTLAVLAAAYLDDPRPTPQVLAAHLTIVLLSLLAGTLMCLQVQRIRTRLRRQKHDLQVALQQIRDLAMRDHLTGLFNRRQMSELLELELRRCQRSGRPLLLAQLDIDHFKAINDSHGHAVGDLALQAFAETALSHLRGGDVLARWGGEEFVLLLGDTPPAAAAELLERVRTAVAARPLRLGAQRVAMTVSIGWAQHQRGEPLQQTLERADQALYAAKHGGRNRVVRARPRHAARSGLPWLRRPLLRPRPPLPPAPAKADPARAGARRGTQAHRPRKAMGARLACCAEPRYTLSRTAAQAPALAVSPCLQRTTAMFHRARWKALENWVLPADPRQRIRLAMAGFACLLMLCCVLIVNLMAAAGLARQDWVGWWTVATMGGLLTVLLLIRIGRARHWRDPSLTQLQIRYSLACTASAYVVAGQARGIVPVILSVILVFGIFGLSPRQMVQNMAFALALFAAGFGAVAWLGEPGRIPALEAAYGAMVILVLLGSTFLAMRLQKIRAQLTRQKLELTRALAQIRHLATHDELTGLPNRRYMMALLESEQLRSQRDASVWMAALLDVDHFKQVNDTHGHAAGDQVLQAFATAVRKAVRGTDVLARWGGEEFLLLLHDTQPPGARPVLERVRQAVQAREVVVQGQRVRITVSIGVAAHIPGKSVAQLLEQADQALYRAKSLGRNRVVEAAPPQPSAAPAAQPGTEVL